MINDEIKNILKRFKNRELRIIFNDAEEAAECWHWLKDNGIRIASDLENDVYPNEKDIKAEAEVNSDIFMYYVYYEWLVWGCVDKQYAISHHSSDEYITFELIKQLMKPPINKEEFMQFLLEV